jgi:hypothetical protein
MVTRKENTFVNEPTICIFSVKELFVFITQKYKRRLFQSIIGSTTHRNFGPLLKEVYPIH